LVDLLKHPVCVGDARRQVLEQLSRHYDKSSADQWEFVEYDRLHQRDLDHTTPPQSRKALRDPGDVVQVWDATPLP
jgi:hypothetical protein